MRSIPQWTLALLVASLLATGCKKSAPPPDPSKVGGIDGNAVQHVRRGVELQKLRNDLGQLAKFYQTYSTEMNKPPANWSEFKVYIQRDAPHIVRLVDDGHVEILWGVPSGSGNLLAYEKEKDLRGNHVVVMADASVKSMTDQELQAARQGGR